MKNLFLSSVIGFLLCSCSSVEKRPEIETTLPKPAVETSTSGSHGKPAEIIDLRALQTAVRLDPPSNDLGYREKSFNTCQVGAGYAASVNCRSRILVVIHFKLMCRDTEGTISEAITEEDLQPIANRSLAWNLKNASGEIRTDANGYGQVVLVATESQRSQRMQLRLNNDFLALRASEVRSIIAPKNWCE